MHVLATFRSNILRRLAGTPYQHRQPSPFNCAMRAHIVVQLRETKREPIYMSSAYSLVHFTIGIEKSRV